MYHYVSALWCETKTHSIGNTECVQYSSINAGSPTHERIPPLFKYQLFICPMTVCGWVYRHWVCPPHPTPPTPPTLTHHNKTMRSMTSFFKNRLGSRLRQETINVHLANHNTAMNPIKQSTHDILEAHGLWGAGYEVK